MAFSKTFERELDKLFYRRTHWLRRAIGAKKPGQPPKFDHNQVKKSIERLQQIASDAFAHRFAKNEFNQFVIDKASYRIKGRGAADKKRKFKEWFAGRFSKTHGGIIYTFWAAKSCRYVGRTEFHSDGGRPASHFDKYWFSGITKATLYSIRAKSHIPKLECIAIHHFQPSMNKNRAATIKRTKACPLCDIHRIIERELKDIFA